MNEPLVDRLAFEMFRADPTMVEALRRRGALSVLELVNTAERWVELADDKSLLAYRAMASRVLEIMHELAPESLPMLQRLIREDPDRFARTIAGNQGYLRALRTIRGAQ